MQFIPAKSLAKMHLILFPLISLSFYLCISAFRQYSGHRSIICILGVCRIVCRVVAALALFVGPFAFEQLVCFSLLITAAARTCREQRGPTLFSPLAFVGQRVWCLLQISEPRESEDDLRRHWLERRVIMYKSARSDFICVELYIASLLR